MNHTFFSDFAKAFDRDQQPAGITIFQCILHTAVVLKVGNIVP